MTSTTPVSTLPFVGPKYQQLLANLGIQTIRDLLYHLPTRYIDLSQITLIDQLEAGEMQVVQAVVESVKSVRLKGGRTMTTAVVYDTTGPLQLTWFNQPFMAKSLSVGPTYRVAGEVEQRFGKLQMANPTVELASKPAVHTGRIVPVYAQTAGISSKWLRARIAPLLSKLDMLLPEFLPADTLERQQLLPLATAIRMLHAPQSMTEVQLARRRLAFDEVLLLQLAALERKAALEQGPAAPIMAIGRAQLADWIGQLPFELTSAQIKVIDEILADLGYERPMNRLLEGDVGSGKTVVAMMAAMAALANGYQVAVMVPTSVLAHQHWLTFQQLASSMTVAGRQPTVALRTSKNQAEPADITIGTQALIVDGLEFASLGLVIIDEQHRFGVAQRAQLLAKAKRGVHTLSMTATPIPRTLALTVYGDLDVSIIDQLPANRLPIRTHIVPSAKRRDMEGFLAQTMAQGQQVYIVCPLIDESDTLAEVRTATAEFERLQQVFAGHSLALLHGRLKPKDKDAILTGFKERAFDALVATPVVEVGVDVPNATIIVIEGAERFGLAQLHQLRGRVGRGSLQSYCFLLSDATNPKEVTRLRHLEHEQRGLALAELDLATRGPGEVYGRRQSGIPELKVASMADTELISQARAEAEQLVEQLSQQAWPLLRQEVERAQPLIAPN
jgi:ATP-dependent DNA helicase RecG